MVTRLVNWLRRRADDSRETHERRRTYEDRLDLLAQGIDPDDRDTSND